MESEREGKNVINKQQRERERERERWLMKNGRKSKKCRDK